MRLINDNDNIRNISENFRKLLIFNVNIHEFIRIIDVSSIFFAISIILHFSINTLVSNESSVMNPVKFVRASVPQSSTQLHVHLCLQLNE